MSDAPKIPEDLENLYKATFKRPFGSLEPGPRELQVRSLIERIARLEQDSAELRQANTAANHLYSETCDQLEAAHNRVKCAEQDAARLLHLAEAAWGVIANAGNGDWTRETEEWRAAAATWREMYHEQLDSAMQAQEEQP